MRLFLFLKTLFRTPFKTTLTLLLLTVTAFLMFYSVAENTVVTREYESTVNAYQGIGAVEAKGFVTGFHLDSSFLLLDCRNTTKSNNPMRSSLFFSIYEGLEYTGLTHTEMDVIASLPQVTSVSTRYMTAGVSDTFTRIDNRSDYYNFTSRFVIEADFKGFTRSRSQPGSDIEIYYVSFENFTVLAGDVEWFAHLDSRIVIEATTFSTKQLIPRAIGSMVFGGVERTASLTIVGRTPYDELYTLEYLESLTPESRYVIVGRVEPQAANVPQFFLTDWTTLGWWEQMHRLDDKPSNYLELDEYAPLSELIEVTNTDLHTFDVVYTDNMKSIMRIANGEMGLVEGRLLTLNDVEERSSTCVVSEAFLKSTGLQIGDTISLLLGDVLFEQNAVLGAVASTQERRARTFTKAQFEIVGVYADFDSKRHQAENVTWCYSVNTIFVPISAMPVEIPEEHIVKPGEFSIVIENAKEISAFLEESYPVIRDELGLTMFLNDGGWLAIEEKVKNMEGLSGVRMVLLTVANIMAIALTIYLFIGRKKHDYAVMRALGTKKSVANCSLYIPLGLIAVITTLTGTVFAYYYTSGTVESSLHAYKEFGIAADASIPVAAVAICVVAQLLILSLITAIQLYRMSKKQPLALLQENSNKKIAGEIRKRANLIPISTAVTQGIRSSDTCTNDEHTFMHSKAANHQAANRGYTVFGHIIHYLSLRIRRNIVKTVLSILLALLLFGSLGQYTVILNAYRTIYESIEVKAKFVDALNLRSAISVGDSGYVKDPFYEYSLTAECEFTPISIAMTNDIGKYTGRTVDVIFMEGYDMSYMDVAGLSDRPVCILSASTMDALGIRLGDVVRFNRAGLYEELERAYIDDIEDDKTLAVQWNRLWQRLDEMSVFYTVVGRADSVAEQNVAFVPVSTGLFEMTYDNTTFDLVEYTLINHSIADEFRVVAEKAVFGASATAGGTNSVFVLDTSEADRVLRTVKLLDELYPIAVVLAIIIGCISSSLIVNHNAREAAILCALGMCRIA